jgi:NAD(P)-dependent dehydrogenase (short-subunit alcohol dehydrogenase family)
LVARLEAELEESAALVREHGGGCEVVVGDVIDDATAERVVALTEERLGPVDLLVNNAGQAQLAPLADVDPEQWWHILDVNLRAPVVWLRAVLPGMRARAHGRIVNCSSPAAFTPLPYLSSYCASKAALSQLTACLALEVAADGVAAPAFGPAALTDMSRSTFENDVMPAGMRDGYRAAFTTDPDALLDYTLTLFRFLAAGGADHLSGAYVGRRPSAEPDTPTSLSEREPSSAGRLLAAATADRTR